MARSEPKVAVQILWQSEDSIRVTPLVRGSAVESTVKTSRVCPFHSALVADRARHILSLLARANAGQTELFDELVAAGRAIYVDLLPSFLKDKLPSAPGSHLLLHLDRPLLGIPWELLHDGDDFLGRRFRMGRLLSVADEGGGRPQLKRRMEPPLSVLMVADPAGDLPEARRELERLEPLLEDAPIVGSVTTLCGEVTLSRFRDELAKADVLHYAGHADWDGEEGSARLRLADGAFGARLIAQLRGQVDFPGLVFLNACGSADTAQRLASGGDPLAGTSGLASALVLAGVRHVVGTLWEVRDEVAQAFAEGFYRSLGASTTIGEAMEAARGEVLAHHGEGSLLWADHLLYGDPTWRVALPARFTFDDLDTLDGLELKHRTELQAADPSTRILAAVMLLRLGDRTMVSHLRRDLPVLEGWLAQDATASQRRQGGYVVGALATAAGLGGAAAPADMLDPGVLHDLLARLEGG